MNYSVHSVYPMKYFTDFIEIWYNKLTFNFVGQFSFFKHIP